MRHVLRAVRHPRRLTPVGALAAALFVAQFLALPPHLVHHIADADDSRATCPQLAQSQQTPVVQVDPPPLVSPGAVEVLPPAPPGALPPSSLVAPHSPRAPPGGAASA
ncbi:MAG TPA: hypothetical protein VGT06_07855 [Candidatus Methylomirabilis sp.]|jgi:hypothetical protein|nr:hypothetical protein [Candidatus Methylomirabilis sp.]